MTNHKVTMHTVTGTATGYAQSATTIIRAMYDAGLDVHYQYTYDDHIYEENTDDDVVNALRNRPARHDITWITYAPAPIFKTNAGHTKIGWTMIEVDRITPEWVYACNLMHEVWVPTRLQQENFKRSGVTRPILTMPLPANQQKFNPDAFTPKWTGSACFRFIAVGYWQQRKRFDLLLKTFTREFADSQHVALICKIQSNRTDDEIQRQIAYFTNGRNPKNLLVINGDLPWWEMAQLYRVCHAFVLPTAGEGWGYTPLEAIMCGIPVITTNAQGTGEILRDETGKPYPGVSLINAKLANCPVDHPYYTDSKWWEADEDHLAELMHESIDRYTEKKGGALHSAPLLAERYQAQRTIDLIRDRLDHFPSS